MHFINNLLGRPLVWFNNFAWMIFCVAVGIIGMTFISFALRFWKPMFQLHSWLRFVTECGVEYYFAALQLLRKTTGLVPWLTRLRLAEPKCGRYDRLPLAVDSCATLGCSTFLDMTRSHLITNPAASLHLPCPLSLHFTSWTVARVQLASTWRSNLLPGSRISGFGWQQQQQTKRSPPWRRTCRRYNFTFPLDILVPPF